jgi:hypothetical protein
MKVLALMAGLLLGVAGITVATEAGSKTDSGMCRVVCTPAPAAKPAPRHARAKAVRTRAARAHRHGHRHAHRYARHDYYSYREAEAVGSDFHHEWHGRWHAAPNDAPICNCGEGVHIDQGGWTSGVGYAAAQQGGFMDGYGVMHYGGMGNGPTYNSYGQSFQYNPSMPRPFAPRGGFGPRR